MRSTLLTLALLASFSLPATMAPAASSTYKFILVNRTDAFVDYYYSYDDITYEFIVQVAPGNRYVYGEQAKGDPAWIGADVGAESGVMDLKKYDPGTRLFRWTITSR